MLDSVSKEDVEEDVLGKVVVDAAFCVHQTMGAGLLESVYEACLCRELELRQVAFDKQVCVPLCYKGQVLPQSLRLDLLVDERLIVEVKACEQILPVHEAQLLSYMKLAGKRLGFILNFNTPLMKTGIKRLVLRR